MQDRWIFFKRKFFSSNAFMKYSLLLVVFSGFSNGAVTPNQLKAQLDKAEGFLSVAPERSYSTLRGMSNISALSPKDQLRWHVSLIKAARSQRDYLQMERSMEAAMELSDEPSFEFWFFALLESGGILLRNQGDTANAKLCYLCAFDYSNTTNEKLSLLGNFSIALIQEGDLKSAQLATGKARDLARLSSNNVQLAKFENVLGVIAFELEDYDSALSHFVTSYQLHLNESKRDSTLIVGINVLFTSLVAKKPEFFSRLYPSIKRLARNSKSKAIEASMFWIDSVFKHSKGLKIDKQWKAKLAESFSHLGNNRMKGLYKKHFAEPLGVEVELTVVKSIGEPTGPPNWFLKINRCDWQKLRSLTVSDLAYSD